MFSLPEASYGMSQETLHHDTSGTTRRMASPKLIRVAKSEVHSIHVQHAPETEFVSVCIPAKLTSPSVSKLAKSHNDLATLRRIEAERV